MRLNVWKTIIFLSSLLLFCTEKEKPTDQMASDSSAQHVPQQYRQLIGSEFGPENFPEDYQEQSGYVFGFMDGDEYLINHVTDDKNQLLWFCQLTRRDESGRPYLKIIDIIVLPEFASDERLMMGSCIFEKQEDEEVVALVNSNPEDLSTRVIKAWRASRSEKKFLDVPVEKVTCVDESYYL